MTNLVVATGRCGSTLLSKCISQHPDVLLLSEFFVGLDHRTRFQRGDVTGNQLAKIVSADHSLASLWLGRGYSAKEVLGKIAREEIMIPRLRKPGFILGALPFITDEPERLHSELIAWAKQQPTQALDKHYPEMFSWLCRRLGKKIWIERSALSTDHLADLLYCFPHACILHIHRDGLETAISMRNHIYFKLAVSVAEDVPDDEELRAMVDCTRPHNDPVVRRIENLPPVEAFGRFWASSIARFYRDIQRLPQENLMDLRFEDLLENPEQSLASIEKFFDLPANKDWISAAVRLISPVKSYASQLSEEERIRLEEACLPGQILLRRDKHPGSTPALELESRIDDIYNEQR